MADWTPEVGFLKKLLIWETFEDTEVHGMVKYPLAGPIIAPATTDPHAVQESSGFDQLFLEHSWFTLCLGSRSEQPLD